MLFTLDFDEHESLEYVKIDFFNGSFKILVTPDLKYKFKETKLLMHSSRENHGYVTKMDILYAKQIILADISQTVCCSTFLISQSHKNFLQD